MSTIDDLLSIELTGVHTQPAPALGITKKLLKHHQGNEYILEIDNTSLESFLACDRASQYRLVYSRTTHPTAALIYGQAIHSALEYFYKHGPNIPAMLAAGEKELLRLPEDSEEWRNYSALERTVLKYVKEYANEPFEPVRIDANTLAVELPFSDHIGEMELNKTLAFDHATLVADSHDLDTLPVFISKLHIVWTGVIDAIVEEQGRLWAMDHKTSSVVGPSYFEQFSLSQQFVGYVRSASKILGKPLNGALLNVIAGRKPTATGKSLEFHRRYYPYPTWLQDEWTSDIMTLIADFVDRLTTGHFPKKTLWCTGKFGTCPYLPVCQSDPDKRSYMLHSDSFANNVWNPLNK